MEKSKKQKQNIKNTENIESTKNIDNTDNIKNTESIEATKNTENAKNIENPKTIKNETVLENTFDCSGCSKCSNCSKRSDFSNCSGSDSSDGLLDCLIIGAGPAGISAALYLKRANKNILVVHQSGSSLIKAKKIENFYGNPLSGEEIYLNGLKGAENLGIDIFLDEITEIDPFVLKTKNAFKVKGIKKEFITKSVLLATGSKPNGTSLIKGAEELIGKGVSVCAVCDGFFYKNKTVAVIGNGEYAKSETEHLLFAKNIYLLLNGKDLKFNVEEYKNLKVFKEKIKNIEKNDTGLKINFDGKINCGKNNKSIKIRDNNINVNNFVFADGVFLALGSAGAIDFAQKLGISQIAGKIKTLNGKTNVNGIFAAGDCTEGENQIIKAANDGRIAAKSIAEYLN